MRTAKIHSGMPDLYTHTRPRRNRDTHSTLGRLVGERAAIYNSFKRSKSAAGRKLPRGEYAGLDLSLNTPPTSWQIARLCGYTSSSCVMFLDVLESRVSRIGR